MTWSYDPSNIGTANESNRLDSVRSLIQDTDVQSQQLQDEEILFHLSQASDDIYLASAIACDSLALKYARYGNTSIDNGGIDVDFNEVAKSYRVMASQMRKQSQKTGISGIGVPRAGGISKDAMKTVYQNEDRVDPSFRQRQFRNPPAISSEDDDDRIR